MTVVDPEDGVLLAVAQGPDAGRRFIAAASEGGRPAKVSIGLGFPVADVCDVAQAALEARMALDQIDDADAGDVAHHAFDLLDASRLVLSHVPRSRRQLVTQILDPIAEHRDLLSTLTIYLEHDCAVPATAAALHLHPNSVRYRLARIEEVLGRRLSDPRTLTSLFLALQARKLFGSRHDG
jgi:DNA-binding PucR family transcriptional regulator